ncbi:MAG: hypothetical protein AAF598_14420, partial [Bacteroidota bacterium]
EDDLGKVKTLIEREYKRLGSVLEVVQDGGDFKINKTYHQILKAYDSFLKLEATYAKNTRAAIEAYEYLEALISAWEVKDSRSSSFKGKHDKARKKAILKIRENNTTFKQGKYAEFQYLQARKKEKFNLKTMEDLMANPAMFQRFENHCKNKEYNVENLYFWQELVALMEGDLNEPLDKEDQAKRLESGLLKYDDIRKRYLGNINITSAHSKKFKAHQKEISTRLKQGGPQGISASYPTLKDFLEGDLLKGVIDNTKSMRSNIRILMQTDILTRFKSNEL